MSQQQSLRYVTAGKGSQAFNKAARWLTAHGLSLLGSRILHVRGRRSGELRTTIVNPLDVDGGRYLLAPRGHTEWVRNLRAAGGVAELSLGRRVTPVQATELPDADKTPILRTYLVRYGWELGMFFDDLTKNSTDAEIEAVAPGFPVFRLEPRP